MCCISIVRSLYFRILSASFLITFLSPEFATSINIHVSFSLSRIIMSGFFVGDSSVSLYLLNPQCVYLAFLTCLYWFWHMFIPVFLSNCTPVSLHMLKCSCAHTLSCLFTYCSFASIGHADIIIIITGCWKTLSMALINRMTMGSLRNVTQCSLVEIYRRFRETCFLHLHVEEWGSCTVVWDLSVHGVTPHKTRIFSEGCMCRVLCSPERCAWNLHLRCCVFFLWRIALITFYRVYLRAR